MACPNHDKDKCMVCLSCKICICSRCIDEKHHDGHIFRTLENVSKTVIKDLENRLDSSLVTRLETDLKDVSVKLQEEENVFLKSKLDVEKRREQIGHLMDEAANNIFTQLDRQRKSTFTDLNEFKQQTEETLQKVKDFRDEIGKLKSNDNLLDVIEQGWEMKVPEIGQLNFPKVNRLEFISDIHGNTENIDTILGELVQRDVYGQGPLYTDEISTAPRVYSPSDEYSVCTLDLYGDGPENPPCTFHGSLVDISTEVKSVIPSCKRIKCDVTLTPIFQFEVSSVAFTMSPTVDGNVWLKCYKDDTMKLFGKNGVLRQCASCNTTVSDVIVTPVTKKVLVSCPSKKCIKQVVAKQDKYFLAASTVIRTDPLAPNNICGTPNGDILVTVTNKTSLSEQLNTTSALVKYNSKGKELARVHKDTNGRDIFHIPCNICISNTGQVAVINGTGKFKGHLVLFNKDLKLELRCIGFGVTVSADEEIPKLPEKFCVNDVLFNDNNFILITEHHSRTVHLLDPRCRPLKVLMTGYQSAAPRSLALNTDGNVWIGFDDGVINVYKYKCEFTPS